MRRPALLWMVFGGLLVLTSQSTRAQTVVGPTSSQQVYGTSWGVASFGLKRTWSSYSSPFGVGYGYGMPPSGFVPGKFGVELWRPNDVAPDGVYGVEHRYRTFPYPYPPGPPVYGPSIGVYAPGFGPELRSPVAR